MMAASPVYRGRERASKPKADSARLDRARWLRVNRECLYWGGRATDYGDKRRME